MSKTIRISDYSYEYLQSLDGKTTTNLDEIIRKHSLKKEGISSKSSTRTFYAPKLLSVAILAEFISKNYINRSDLKTDMEKALIGWEKKFPLFIKSSKSWDGPFQKALDFNLHNFRRCGILKRRKILKVNYLSGNFGENLSRVYENLNSIFIELFPDSKYQIKIGKKIVDMEIVIDNKLKYLVEFKTFEKTSSLQSILDVKDEAIKLVNISPHLDFYNKEYNIIECNKDGKKFKFQLTLYDREFAAYELNEKLDIFMKNPKGFFDEIINFYTKKSIGLRDYLPNIFDYYIETKLHGSRKRTLLLNTMKVDYLSRKRMSKYLSVSERLALRNEMENLIESDSYQQELSIKLDKLSNI